MEGRGRGWVSSGGLKRSVAECGQASVRGGAGWAGAEMCEQLRFNMGSRGLPVTMLQNVASTPLGREVFERGPSNELPRPPGYTAT